MTKILDSFNAKYATRVRNTQDGSTWKFEYCAVSGHGMFANNDHRLTNEATGEAQTLGFSAIYVMKNYEILEEKPGVKLNDLYSSAVSSYGWSSMDPERAARVMLHGYEDCINDDLTKIPEQEHEQYIADFKSHLRTIIARNGNVASAFVTGRSKFNSRRNEKANNAYDRAVQDLNDWRERRIKAILKAIEAAKPQAQRDAEEWARIERDLLGTLATIEAIDEGTGRGCSRSLFVNSIVGKAGTLANNGKADLLERYMATVTRYNESHKKPAITARHSFWKLQEVLEQMKERREDRQNRENVEIQCEACTIVKNYEEDRLQLIYDGKPDYSTIQTLKSNGFRWSPRFTAWQRQLTVNAYYAASRVTGVEVDKIRKAA